MSAEFQYHQEPKVYVQSTSTQSTPVLASVLETLLPGIICLCIQIESQKDYSQNHRESLEFWVEDLPTAHTRPLPLIESRLQSIRFLHSSRHREISLTL